MRSQESSTILHVIYDAPYIVTCLHFEVVFIVDIVFIVEATFIRKRLFWGGWVKMIFWGKQKMLRGRSFFLCGRGWGGQ